MNIELIKSELEQELLQLSTVREVYWEYPAFFSVETIWGCFAIGDVNGPIGWNDLEGRIDGETNETSPKAIANAFQEWLIDKCEGVSNDR